MDPRVGIYIEGAFMTDHYTNVSENFLIVYIQQVYVNSSNSNFPNGEKEYAENVTGSWHIPVVNTELIDYSTELTKKRVFDIDSVVHHKLATNQTYLRIHMVSNFNANLAINLSYDDSPIDKDVGIIYAAIVLLGLYVMIIWELVHRTFAAMIASTLSIGILAYMNERPPMSLLMSWIDIETLLLLYVFIIKYLCNVGSYMY